MPWTSGPVRVDRSKQQFHRLPPRASAADTRIWIVVPEHIRLIDSGAFAFAGKQYRLSELKPVSAKRYCRNTDGSRWACGRMAAIALGNLVRGRRLLCMAEESGDRVSLRGCRAGTVGAAEAMILAGFARGAMDGPLRPLENKARAAGAGLWRSLACQSDFDGC